MFNAIIPLAQPIVAVQVDVAKIKGPDVAELLSRLETYFMRSVVLVAWGENSQFVKYGFPCPEELLIQEDLDWRRFDLLPDPEIPF